MRETDQDLWTDSRCSIKDPYEFLDGASIVVARFIGCWEGCWSAINRRTTSCFEPLMKSGSKTLGTETLSVQLRKYEEYSKK